MSVSVVRGDITQLKVGAIVNAANELMLGGGGVDGAIHEAAGDDLLEACIEIPEVRPRVRCPTGTCQITPGFDLPAKWVIHTVGPVWRGGGRGEPELLRSCYRSSLELALNKNLSSIAFPAISCGAYGYPVDQAASIAIEIIHSTLSAANRELEVTLVAYSSGLFDAIDLAMRNFKER